MSSLNSAYQWFREGGIALNTSPGCNIQDVHRIVGLELGLHAQLHVWCFQSLKQNSAADCP